MGQGQRGPPLGQGVKDRLEAPPQVVQAPQGRDPLKQRCQLVLVLGRQILRVAAKQPHLRAKLLPLLPNPPPGWTADKAEGSTTDTGSFKLTNVHRDYRKGEGDSAPTTSISILDSAANPDYVEATTAAWNFSTSSTEGYSKSATLDGNQGFETFENEGKHGTLWLMVAKRYFVQIETKDQDSAALQEWAKRVDLKKLAEIK